MIEVIKYIDTIGSAYYRLFLEQTFDFNMLYNINNKCDVIFDGWTGEKNDDGFTFIYEIPQSNKPIEIIALSTYYCVVKCNKIINLPLPLTVDDFINDMSRNQIPLFWIDKIDEIFEPKDYLHRNEIKEYYVNLLKIMEKENELI